MPSRGTSRLSAGVSPLAAELGREPLDEQGWEPRVTFTGDTFVVTLADGRIPIKGTYKLDPTRNPKTMPSSRNRILPASG